MFKNAPIFKERVTPEENNTVVFQSHYATYQFAKEFSKTKIILDIGCGTGYGLNYLSQYSRFSVGVDCSEEAISYARNHYRRNNLNFFVMDTNRLGFESGSFDLACMFQVIEHVKDFRLSLSEAARILKQGGILLLSTPNKRFSSCGLSAPENIYHSHEFELYELDDMLRQYFTNVEIFGQNLKKDIKASLSKNPLKEFIKRIDIFNIRKIIPVSMRLKIAEGLKVVIEEQVNSDDFVISKEDVPGSENFLAVCRRA